MDAVTQRQLAELAQIRNVADKFHAAIMQSLTKEEWQQLHNLFEDSKDGKTDEIVQRFLGETGSFTGVLDMVRGVKRERKTR